MAYFIIFIAIVSLCLLFYLRFRAQNLIIKNQLKRINRKNKNLLSIANNLEAGIILLNKNARIIASNKKARKIFKNINEINALKEIESEHFVRFVMDSLPKKSAKCEMKIKDLDCQIHIQKLKNKGNIILIDDISQKILAKNIQKEFSQNVTHELKTPLSVIIASSEMIKNDLVPIKDMKKFGEKIYEEGKGLQKLIDSVLKLSFYDETNLMRTEVRLENIIQKAQNHFKNLAMERNINIQTQMESCCIIGVEELLESAIFNLISNAIIYNKIGGFVKIRLKKHKNKIILSIKDSGIGIPEGEKKRVFERFYRVDKSRSKMLGGTGLGLAIVQRSCDYHGAKLRLKSKVNEGSEFSIIFNADSL